MRSSSTSYRDPQTPVFASLLGPVLLVAIAGVIGCLLLVTVKWLVVTLLIAIGVALVVVPIAAGRRIAGTVPGPVRRHRILQLATAVLLGAALIVLGVVVSHHGWLLIVVPVGIVLISRLVDRFTRQRAA